MSSHDELGPSATKRIERSARRVVRATGLGRPARQAQGALRQARSRLSEWVAPSESETALHERRDNAAIRLLFSFVLHADSICIDVGAHQGSMLSDMVRVAPLGRHIAYEPLPHLYAELVERFPTVDVRNAALANVDEETTFRFVRNLPGMSGLRERAYPTEPEVEVIPVRTERLDDHLSSDVVPALIKIDVEGAEMLVLEGAQETLRRHHPLLIFEYGRGTEQTSYRTSPSQIYGFLADIGYRIFSLSGDGPLSLDAFSSSPDWNWVAHL